jgi:hypothetical protein
MRRPLLFAVLLSLAACGEESEPRPIDGPSANPPPAAAPTEGFSKEGIEGAGAVLDAYLAAAKVADGPAMYALGTPEWRATEAKKRRGFTPNLANKTIVLKSYEVEALTLQADGAVHGTVRAVFVIEGKDDKDPMRFVFVRRDGRWWINGLG